MAGILSFMAVFQFLFLSFLPLLLWIIFCVGSRFFSLVSAFYGILLALLAVFIASSCQWGLSSLTLGLSGISVLLFSAFIQAAFLEESVKLIALRLLPGVRSRECHPRVLLAYAVLIGVAFASFETLVYALRNPSILFVRTFTSLCVHAFGTLLSGMALIRFRQNARKLDVILFFGAAVVLHGMWNFFIALGGFFVFPSYLCLLTLLILAFYYWNRT